MIDLKPGDYILVGVGTRGRQVMVVRRVVPGGKVYGRKWLARAKRWSKDRPVYPSEVLRHATPQDRNHYRTPTLVTGALQCNTWSKNCCEP